MDNGERSKQQQGWLEKLCEVPKATKSFEEKRNHHYNNLLNTVSMQYLVFELHLQTCVLK